MTTIPDGLPSLARGCHDRSEGKACVMEYVSVIDGTFFTDAPDCTNYNIALAAQALNDCLSDEDRHLLVPFIGRLRTARRPQNGEWEKERRWRQAMGRYGSLYREMERRIGIRYLYQNKLGELTSHPYDPAAGIAYLDEILTSYEQLLDIKPQQVETEALAKARVLIETRMAGV